MFMQILANNAGCTKNNEQKKKHKKNTQKNPDSHRSLDNDSLDSKNCGFLPKWASNYLMIFFAQNCIWHISNKYKVLNFSYLQMSIIQKQISDNVHHISVNVKF